jgi:hypothetical protein
MKKGGTNCKITDWRLETCTIVELGGYGWGEKRKEKWKNIPVCGD